MRRLLICAALLGFSLPLVGCSSENSGPPGKTEMTQEQKAKRMPKN